MGDGAFESSDDESFERLRNRLIENAGGEVESAGERPVPAMPPRMARWKALAVAFVLFFIKIGLITFGLYYAIPYLFEMFPAIPYQEIGFWNLFVMVTGFMIVWIMWPARVKE